MEHFVYLFINTGSILIPFVASFDRRLRFDRQWKYLFPAMALTMLVFIPWDILKTHLGVWGFNPRYITGYYIGNLPVEEWIFFIAIPYACLFTYHALNTLIKKELTGSWPQMAVVITGILLLITGLCNLHRLYTCVTFIATGVFLLFHRFVFRKSYLGRFLLMYLVTLIPFFVVDGLLTGSFIPEEVVYYDDLQNLGIRIGTIPPEDAVYGLLMLLMNVSWYEFLKQKFPE
jgi:lycopene cyclase domain-containing protein